MKFYRYCLTFSLLFWVNGNEEFVYVFMQSVGVITEADENKSNRVIVLKTK